MTSRPVTGRAVFVVAVAAFGVVVAANLVLAAFAIGTFPGLETRNSYVASQRFEADRAAQKALGWTVDASVANGALRLAIADRDGDPVNPAKISATIGRATHVAEDVALAFVFDGVALAAPVDLAPGNWNLRFVATAANGAEFRRRVPILIK